MLKLFKRHRPTTHLMTGREAVARALYSEKVQGSRLDLLDYDHTPRLQAQWLVEADLRIAHAESPDRFIAQHFGYTPAQWMSLPALFKVDKREEFALVTGLAS